MTTLLFIRGFKSEPEERTVVIDEIAQAECELLQVFTSIPNTRYTPARDRGGLIIRTERC